MVQVQGRTQSPHQAIIISFLHQVIIIIDLHQAIHRPAPSGFVIIIDLHVWCCHRVLVQSRGATKKRKKKEKFLPARVVLPPLSCSCVWCCHRVLVRALSRPRNPPPGTLPVSQSLLLLPILGSLLSLVLQPGLIEFCDTSGTTALRLRRCFLVYWFVAS
jgi:hypothetical protein